MDCMNFYFLSLQIALQFLFLKLVVVFMDSFIFADKLGVVDGLVICVSFFLKLSDWCVNLVFFA